MKTHLQIDFHSQPEFSKPMLAVNFGFGRISERVISKVMVEIVQWSSLGKKCPYSIKAFTMTYY